MDTPLAQRHAFIETIVKDVDNKRKIFNIDINNAERIYYIMVLMIIVCLQCLIRWRTIK